MARTAEQIVSAEVHYCVSYLVSTLANGTPFGQNDLNDLVEQARELAAPLSDWEEAAMQAGWLRETARITGNVVFRHESEKTVYMYDGWQDLCETNDIEPYDREVFEHWIVSSWLADKLEAKGEKVDRDFAGMVVWARTTSGQGIASDSVVEAIVADLVREYGA